MKMYTPLFHSQFFTSLLSFNGLFAPIGEIAHERVHLLSGTTLKRRWNTKTVSKLGISTQVAPIYYTCIPNQ